MESCSIPILIWSLITFLATILLLITIFYFSFITVEESLISQFNRSLLEFCETLPPITYREQVHIPDENGVYEKILAVALIDISLATSDANCTNILPIPNPPGFTNQLRIEGIDPINQELNIYAYIFWNRKLCRAVISFTGTEIISSWQADLEFQQVAPTVLNGYQDGVLVHKGFYDIYLSIRDKLWNWWNKNQRWVRTLYITGHSLGGALSTICGYDFAEVFMDLECGTYACNSRNCSDRITDDCGDSCFIKNLPIHYSFAAPRSGNPNYAQIFNQRLPTSLRINNTEDIIPALPPARITSYTYEQTGGNVPFTVSLGSLSKNHTQAYLDYLPFCAQVAPCRLDE